jgi:hypothetical protein
MKPDVSPAPELNQSVLKTNNISNISSTHSFNDSSLDYVSSKFFSLTCGYKYCYNKDIKIPLSFLFYFMNEKQITKIVSVKTSDNLTDYYLYSSNDFYSFLNPKQGDKNEASLGLDSSIFSAPSSK